MNVVLPEPVSPTTTMFFRSFTAFLKYPTRLGNPSTLLARPSSVYVKRLCLRIISIGTSDCGGMTMSAREPSYSSASCDGVLTVRALLRGARMRSCRIRTAFTSENCSSASAFAPWRLIMILVPTTAMSVISVSIKYFSKTPNP